MTFLVFICAHRLYQVSEDEEAKLQNQMEKTDVIKNKKVEVVRQQYLARKARFRESYLMEDRDFQEYPQIKKKDRRPSSILQTENDKHRMQARFRRAVSQLEVRSDILARQKAYELSELRKEVERRKIKQEEQRIANQERDRRICEDEMARLLKHAKDHPFWS